MAQDKPLRHYWNLLQTGKWIVAATTVLGFGIGYLYGRRTTPIYSATASLLMADQQSPMMQFGVTTPPALETEIQVLKSRGVAEQVVDSLSLRFQLVQPARVTRDAVFSQVSVDTLAKSGDYRLTKGVGGGFALARAGGAAAFARVRVGERVDLPGGGSFTLAPRSASYPLITFSVRPYRSAVAALAKAITVSQPNPDATVLSLNNSGSDAEIVGQVPNILAKVYIDRRRESKASQSASTVSFLQTQAAAMSQQLDANEHKIGDFRLAQQYLDPMAEGSAELSRIIGLESQRENTKAERDGLTLVLNDLAKLPAGSDSILSLYQRAFAYPELAGNSAASTLMAQLVGQEKDRSDLLQRRTPADPDVKDASARIAATETSLSAIISAWFTTLNSTLAAEETELRGYQSQLQRIPKAAIDYDRLQRQLATLEQVFTTIVTREKDAEVANAVQDAGVRVLDPALRPTSPISPNRPLITLVSGIIGLILGLIALFLREGLDRAVHTKEDVRQIVGLPTLGLIPLIDGSRSRSPATRQSAIAGAFRRLMPETMASKAVVPGSQHRGTMSDRDVAARLLAKNDPKNPVAEAFRTVRTNLTFAFADNPPKTLVFSSPMPGDGKTTTVSNLAITMAQQGLRVLLIDADLRRGVLNNAMDVPRQPGLSNVLVQKLPLSEAVHSIDVGDAQLSFLATGTLPPNPAELLGSQRMREFLRDAEEQYDMIIIDSAPLNVVTDAAILGTLTDGVIIVARAGITTMDALGMAVDLLRHVRARVFGAILNGVDFRRDAHYYNAYGYGHYYSYYYYHQDPEAV